MSINDLIDNKIHPILGYKVSPKESRFRKLELIRQQENRIKNSLEMYRNK